MTPELNTSGTCSGNKINRLRGLMTAAEQSPNPHQDNDQRCPPPRPAMVVTNQIKSAEQTAHKTNRQTNNSTLKLCKITMMPDQSTKHHPKKSTLGVELPLKKKNLMSQFKKTCRGELGKKRERPRWPVKKDLAMVWEPGEKRHD